MVEIIFRIIGAAILGIAGWRLGLLGAERLAGGTLSWIVPLTLMGVVVGLLVAPYLSTRPWRWIRQAPAQVVLSAIIGLLLALIVSALLALPLSRLPGWWGSALPIALAVVLSYLGVSLMVQRGRELAQALGPLPIPSSPREAWGEQLVLDTNAIIDGRIADISQTGFIQGTLLIPRFVLDELRHIADSPDPLRRNRGRRGLDVLTKLQKESDVPVQVSDIDFEDTREVDAKLVRLAKTLHCPIVSNDFNLNRVAELQGVRVLNINELANAVKPVVLPGEEMSLHIIQEGKEVGQGVGFLDDGTMVVVEGGKRYLNTELDIVVTRVLQTAAGRMIFAHPKNSSDDRNKR